MKTEQTEMEPRHTDEKGLMSIAVNDGRAMGQRMGGLLILLVLAGLWGGCLSDDDGKQVMEIPLIEAPEWIVGQWWLYTIVTPDFPDEAVRLVVADDQTENATAYMLTTAEIAQARRHAVLNHNPFLGRILKDNLSTFENGVPQSFLSFPIVEGAAWEFTLFSTQWNATANSVDSTSKIAEIEARAADGATLLYRYDAEVGWFRTLTWTDAGGIEQVKMSFADGGLNHTGEVYFIRAGDLYSGEWDGPDIEMRDTLLTGDHPRDGEWDDMIYFLDATCQGGTITFALRDNSALNGVEESWGPGESEHGTIGVIPSPSDEYLLTLSMTGSSHFRLLIAGAVLETYSLT